MSRKVVLAGATGVVGSELLFRLAADPTVAEIHVIGRRKPTFTHAKIKAHVVANFASVPPLPAVDEVYLALGTTIQTAGSQAAFRAVDFEANLAVAEAALTAGARVCGLVSAMAADAKSSIFYNRVKGELEDALTALPFTGLVIARPSLLVGNRAKLGQPERPKEKIAMVLSRVLRPLIPKNYLPIEAADVANALLLRTPSAQGRVVLLSGAMQSSTVA